MPIKYTPLNIRALAIAEREHHGQFDRLGMPYVMHPIDVASRLSDPKLQCAALLHDILEDTPMTRDDLIEEGIPESVVSLVEMLTRKDIKDNYGKKKEKYEDYIQRISMDKDASTVKAADLHANLNPDRMGLVENRIWANDHVMRYERALAVLRKKWPEVV